MIAFSSNSLSFGSMLLLVSTRGTVEIPSLVYYTVDADVSNFFETSSFETEDADEEGLSLVFPWGRYWPCKQANRVGPS